MKILFKIIGKVIKKVFLFALGSVFFFVFWFFRDTYEEKREAFQAVIESQLRDKESVELSLEELFAFDWDQVCFYQHNWYLPWHWDKNKKLLTIIQFLDDKKNELIIKFDKKELRVRENYVLGSPVGKCFGKLQKVKLQRINTSKGSFLYLSVIINPAEIYISYAA